MNTTFSIIPDSLAAESWEFEAEEFLAGKLMGGD
jgi:hypothetical protein